MKEQLISFDTAKLAKEKGFKEPTYYYYRNQVVLSKVIEEYTTDPNIFFETNGCEE